MNVFRRVSRGSGPHESALSKQLQRMAQVDGSTVDDLTAPIRSSEVVIPRNAKGQVPILTNDRGERMLPVFSAVETLKRWTGDVVTSGMMRGTDAFRLAVELHVDAVVLDAAGPVRVEFSMEDARRLASD